jgi:hypothetical protein
LPTNVASQGQSRMTDQSVDAEELNQEMEDMSPRPWVRYWARTFDIYLFSIVVGIPLGFVSPEALENTSDIVFGIVLIFAWVLVEAILLCVTGTTPGKSLLKIRISKLKGGSIEIDEALTRSFRVWWRGMGAGMPIVSLFALIIAYDDLKTDGSSSWDRDSDFIISHEKIGWFRILFIATFMMACFALFVITSIEGT